MSFSFLIIFKKDHHFFILITETLLLNSEHILGNDFMNKISFKISRLTNLKFSSLNNFKK